MTDRYEELMRGLYQGTVPDWIPAEKELFFIRESLRRRCDVCQTIQRNWPCSAFYARSLISDDFSAWVTSAFPETRFDCDNVPTAIYLAFRRTLQRCSAPAGLQELFEYESLVVKDLSSPMSPSPLVGVAAGQAGLPESAVVYRFSTKVTQTHARMTLYSSAQAPAGFARAYLPQLGPEYVLRTLQEGAWTTAGVSDEAAAVLERLEREAAEQ